MKVFFKCFVIVALIAGYIVSCKDSDDIWDLEVPETDENPTKSEIEGFVFKPALVPASAENVQKLKVPEGFQVQKFAENVGKPRILAVSSAGFVYVSDRDAGEVKLLHDTNNDGVSDKMTTVASIKQAHGLAINGSKLYIVAVRELYASNINSDGTLTAPVMLTDALPDGGQHPNRTLAFGPDGLLYITVGSTCNSCPETNKLNATVVTANPDGTNIQVYAKGLRNTIGFGWHPESKEMWGMDHGIDWLGDNEQKEELNKITKGADYGWPYIYGEGKYNPGDRPMGDTTYQMYLQKTTLPTLTYDAHAAPMSMIFYTGSQFPAEYKNDAFVVFRGSWNRSSPVGYKIARLNFEGGQPQGFTDFMTGFLVNNNKAHFARPVGIVQHSDGSLLMSDDTNGVIYRISHQ